MKFWKSLKSSSGSWTKGPSNGPGDDDNGSRAAENRSYSTSMRLEQNQNGSSSQLHSVEVIGGVSQQPTLPPTGPCSSSTPIVTPRMKTPKFDRGRLRWNRRRRRTSNCSNNSVDGENANTNNIKRASNSSTPSFYEEFSSPLEVGTTFVELIKRQGTYLGVVVGHSHSNDSSSAPPRITQLIPGSWAQRSDVLCTGDVIVGVNGLEADTLTREKLRQILDESDRIQLEVNYKLPPLAPSGNGSITTKIIQVTLKKENGSFGIVIRGGDHELLRKRRPFTVVHVNQQGPAYAEGTIRKGDRIRAINGSNLASTRLPELQGLLYQQDKETVFTVEYDIMVQPRYSNTDYHGSILVEIRREIGDILGFGINRCLETGNIYIESVKAASLADR